MKWIFQKVPIGKAPGGLNIPLEPYSFLSLKKQKGSQNRVRCRELSKIYFLCEADGEGSFL